MVPELPVRRPGAMVPGAARDAAAQALSGREEALAREVANQLRPVLAEMNRKLDSIIEKVNDLLAQLDTDSIQALLARLGATAGAVQRDSADELRGGQER
jgi:hypothetical protein